MSEGLQLTLRTALDGLYTNSAAPGSAVTDTVAIDSVISYVTGSGVNSADSLYVAALDIAASGSLTLDLTALTDPLGVALNFARVKALLVIAAPANANDIVIEGGASDPFVGPLAGTTPSLNARPGGLAGYADPGATGYPVVAATNNNLKLANSSSGSPVLGTLIIIGARE